MAALLPLAEAQARLLTLAEPLPVERIPVEEALGRYLAEPLVARRTQPAGDVSAMDGYALRAADLPGPWSVAGESAAGHPYPGLVAPGEAIRISTGALMPTGADMVLMQEDAAVGFEVRAVHFIEEELHERHGTLGRLRHRLGRNRHRGTRAGAAGVRRRSRRAAHRRRRRGARLIVSPTVAPCRQQHRRGGRGIPKSLIPHPKALPPKKPNCHEPKQSKVKGWSIHRARWGRSLR